MKKNKLLFVLLVLTITVSGCIPKISQFEEKLFVAQPETKKESEAKPAPEEKPEKFTLSHSDTKIFIDTSKDKRIIFTTEYLPEESQLAEGFSYKDGKIQSACLMPDQKHAGFIIDSFHNAVLILTLEDSKLKEIHFLFDSTAEDIACYSESVKYKAYLPSGQEVIVEKNITTGETLSEETIKNNTGAIIEK